MIVKDELVASKYYNTMVLSNTKGTVLKRLDFDEMEDASYLFNGMSFDRFPKAIRKTNVNAWYNLGSGLITKTTKIEISMYNIGSNYLFGVSNGSTSYGPFLGSLKLSYGGKQYDVAKGDAHIIIDPNAKTVKVNDTLYTNQDFSKFLETSNNFCIFSTSSSGTNANGGYNACAAGAKFYYMKIWDANDNLLHHFIPYIGGRHMEIYDLVTKTVAVGMATLGVVEPEY